MISVRRTKSLLTASFRFHLAMDTLAVRLYTSSLPRRVRDFHPLERAHGAQTKSSRADLVGAVVTYGALRRGCLDFSVTSSPLYLPRIPSGGDIAGRPWQGCHNSAASFKACAAGFPLKSVGGREKVSLTPALSSRPECLSGSKVCVDRSDSLSHHLLEAIVLAAHLMSLITRVSYLQYRIFSCHGSMKGEENVSFTYHIF